MLFNFWRYSHLMLALSSALFLIFIALSGIILAFEPIQKKWDNKAIVNLKEVSLATTIIALKNNYTEVLNLEVTSEKNVIATVINLEGASQKIYIHPVSAKNLGSVKPQSPFFAWVTNFHRSLFLKGMGRFFVGLFSLLLCFIAVSGVFLLAQRQGGFLKWFTPIREKNFNQRYHVILSRWFLLPILIMASTGVWLSLEKFNLLPQQKEQLNWSVQPNLNLIEKSLDKLPFFNSTLLSEVKLVNFPFSTDVLDYYEIDLLDSKVLVQQYTGEVVSKVKYPFWQLASLWSFKWHTGAGSVLWAFILALSCASVLFFIFSGVQIFLNRKKVKSQPLKLALKDESNYIILVGSQTQNTFKFAHIFAQQLIDNGEKVYIDHLNNYSIFPRAKQLIVFTATYGDGDAPSNAQNFLGQLAKHQQHHQLEYCVVGFGSLEYPKFCGFAIEVENVLKTHTNFKGIMPLTKINEQSKTQFNSWIKSWAQYTKIDLAPTAIKLAKSVDKISFKIVQKVILESRGTFVLKLKPLKPIKYQSGDLIAIIPPNANRERYYSVAKIDNEIILCIKNHDQGKASQYLLNLEESQCIEATIVPNPHFYLPKKAKKILLIANGTGIAPFLGMLCEVKPHQDISLLWGGKNENTFNIYKNLLPPNYINNILFTYQLALSQGINKKYVQYVLMQCPNLIKQTLETNGTIMICGSLAMQNEVLQVIETTCQNHLEASYNFYLQNQQIVTDCY